MSRSLDISTQLDIEGARNRDAVLAASQKTAPSLTTSTSNPAGIPTPAVPFLQDQTIIKQKGRIRVSLGVVLPDNTTSLTTILIPTSLRDTNKHFQNKQLTDTINVDPSQLAGLTPPFQLVYQFTPLLESLTTYDLVGLVVTATDANGNTGVVANYGGTDPSSFPAFNQAPLAQFTTGPIVGGPSDPAAGLITINRLDPATKKFDAEISCRVYAPLDENNNAVNWQAWLGGSVVCVIDFGEGPDHGTNYTIGPSDTLTDPASPVKPNRGYVDVPRKKLTPGTPATWIKNLVNVNGEKSQSNSTNVGFFVGNVNLNIQSLTHVNIVAVQLAPNDPKLERIYLEFQQGTPAAALKNATVFMKVQGDPDTNYKVIVDRFSLKEDELQTAGAIYSTPVGTPSAFAAAQQNGNAVVLDQGVKMIPGVTYVLQLKLKAIGDVIYFATLPSTLPTFTITAGASPDAIADTAKPSSLATPVPVYRTKASLHISQMIVQQNFAQPADPAKFIEIWDGVNTFFDIISYFAEPQVIQTIPGPSSVLTKYPVGSKDKESLGIILKHLKNVFVSNPAYPFIRIRFWAANQAFGLSAAASADGILDLSKPFDPYDGNGAINATNVGQTMISTQNLLFNGHFHYQRGGGGCKGWTTQKAGPFIPAAGGAAALEFDLANHRLHWTGAGGIGVNLPTQRLGDPANANTGFNVDPGDFYTIGLVMWTSLNSHTRSMRLAFLNGADADFGLGQVSVAFSAALTPTPQLFQVKVQLPSNMVLNSALWIQLQCTDGGLTVLNDCLIDLFGMNAGQQFTAFSPRAIFETSSTGNEFWDSTPNYTASQGAQATSPTGTPSAGVTPGGGAAPGFAKLIDLTA